jgi:hypothetical protein
MNTTDRPHVAFLIGREHGATTRLRALLRHLKATPAVLSVGPLPAGLADVVDHAELTPAGDHDASLVDPEEPATIGREGMQELAAWLDRARPDLLVVDGPSDGALLARLLGVPVTLVRDHAMQSGGGHAALLASVGAWLAPYPAVLEPKDSTPEQRQRTVHVGFLSRHEGRRLATGAARRRLGIERDARHVTVLSGDGGTEVDVEQLAAAAGVARAWSFSVVGSCPGATALASDRLLVEPDREAAHPHLVAADVVVAGSDLGAVADAAAVRRPIAVIPGPRHDRGPARLAMALEDARAATVLDAWPTPLAWPALLAELLDQDARPLRRLSDGRAGRVAAEWIDAWALTPPAEAQPSADGLPALSESLRELDLGELAPEGSYEPVDRMSGRMGHLGTAAER